MRTAGQIPGENSRRPGSSISQNWLFGGEIFCVVVRRGLGQKILMSSDLSSHVLIRALILLLCLALFGFVESGFLMISVVFFVLWRWMSLCGEFSGNVPPNGQPRSGRELFLEAGGLLALGVLMPLSMGLYVEPFFSIGLPWGWSALGIVLLGLGLYGLPHVLWGKYSDRPVLRMIWWGSALPIMSILVIALVEIRHPYLKPWQEDRYPLAVERIFSLESIVLASRHAGWVLKYAEILEEAGDLEAAAHYYEQALRLDTGFSSARKRLIEWGYLPEDSNEPAVKKAHASPSPREPFESIQIDAGLEMVDGVTVVLVPVGEVSQKVLERMGHSIQLHLDLPVKIAHPEIPLPRHDRRRGIAVGPQWRFSTIAEAFVESVPEWPQAPIRYLIVTPVDIYAPNTNFVFSVSFDWGGLMGLARFGNPDRPDDLLVERSAKQALSVIIKSFPIPPSTSRECVTSYTRSLDEFDAKGDMPASDTLRHFREQIALNNRDWHRRRPVRSSD